MRLTTSLLIAIASSINSVPVNAMPVGVINPEITQGNLKSTICRPGYTKTIRPKVSYTNAIKRKWLYPETNLRDYELDHVVPLGIGGHPSNHGNLFLQSWEGKCGARVKDVDESRWHRRLCGGQVTLKQARSHFMPWRCVNG
jgi:hypothetical protein